MALKIQIKNEKGISTEYHRILALSALADENMQVKIASYSEESYRALELREEETRSEYEKNVKAINEEVNKPIEEQDSELIAELSDKINNAQISCGATYHIFENTYTFTFDKNTSVSYSDAYVALKQLPEFADAEDV